MHQYDGARSSVLTFNNLFKCQVMALSWYQPPTSAVHKFSKYNIREFRVILNVLASCLTKTWATWHCRLINNPLKKKVTVGRSALSVTSSSWHFCGTQHNPCTWILLKGQTTSWDGRAWVRIPVRVQYILSFPYPSTPVAGLTHHPVQRVPVNFPGSKAAGAWR